MNGNTLMKYEVWNQILVYVVEVSRRQHILLGRNKKGNAVAGDRTRVTRVTGGNTHHYTTTTLLFPRAMLHSYSSHALQARELERLLER
jgi:hypothetical protein